MMPAQYNIPTDSTNIISRYIRYASRCCDASLEYHEANILNLLSAATYGLKMMLPIHPTGLRTNLFFLIIGESSFTRKSTAMKLAIDVQRAALPTVRLPGDFTPGGMQSSLEEMCPGPAVLFVDEFKGLFVKMHKLTYMSGIREIMMNLYDDDYSTYRKANKKGKSDIVEINGANLSIIGNITPSFINDLSNSDIEDGFLARFAMVYPSTKPDRMPIDKIPPIDMKKRNRVVMYLSKLFERMIDLDGVVCTLEPNALMMLDGFTRDIEMKKHDGIEVTLIERLSTMLMKVSMLIAAGELDVDTFTDVVIKQKHVEQATEIIRRWREGGRKMVGQLGSSMFEQTVVKIAKKVEKEGKVKRSTISQNFRVSKKMLDDIQFTLIDRGLIKLELITLNGSKRDTLYFVALKEEEPDVEQVS